MASAKKLSKKAKKAPATSKPRTPSSKNRSRTTVQLPFINNAIADTPEADPTDNGRGDYHPLRGNLVDTMSRATTPGPNSKRGPGPGPDALRRANESAKRGTLVQRRPHIIQNQIYDLLIKEGLDPQTAQSSSEAVTDSWQETRFGPAPVGKDVRGPHPMQNDQAVSMLREMDMRPSSFLPGIRLGPQANEVVQNGLGQAIEQAMAMIGGDENPHPQELLDTMVQSFQDNGMEGNLANRLALQATEELVQRIGKL